MKFFYWSLIWACRVDVESSYMISISLSLTVIKYCANLIGSQTVVLSLGTQKKKLWQWQHSHAPKQVKPETKHKNFHYCFYCHKDLHLHLLSTYNTIKLPKGMFAVLVSPRQFSIVLVTTVNRTIWSKSWKFWMLFQVKCNILGISIFELVTSLYKEVIYLHLLNLCN